MRQLTYLIFLLAFNFLVPVISRAQSANDADTTNFAQIEVAEPYHAFGDVAQGEKVDHIFVFRNTGSQPLIIQNVLTTCGCTVSEWPKDPILPWEEGNLKVEFDSGSKIGRQNKVITIRSNSKSGDYRVRISAMVLPPAKL